MNATYIKTNQLPKTAIAYMALTAVVVWFSLILQFVISIPGYKATGFSTAGAVIQVLSFFTILSNLLVAVSLTVLLIAKNSYWGRFFSKSSIICSVTVYITVVGLIYNIILQSLWAPLGLFKLANELLHTINPLLFIIYWLAFAPKTGLRWLQSLPWLWYPFIYFIYTLIRGAITNAYPYPFMDVATFGYVQVTINCLVVLLVFLIFALLYILAGKLISKIKPVSV